MFLSRFVRVCLRSLEIVLIGANISVADLGYLSRILTLIHPGSQISDLESNNSNKRGEEKISCPNF
jgi:hypothetical protein